MESAIFRRLFGEIPITLSLQGFDHSAEDVMIAIGVVVRPAGFQDLEALHALALTAGLGMTNLPPCRERLGALLAASVAALAG